MGCCYRFVSCVVVFLFVCCVVRIIMCWLVYGVFDSSEKLCGLIGWLLGLSSVLLGCVLVWMIVRWLVLFIDMRLCCLSFSVLSVGVVVLNGDVLCLMCVCDYVMCCVWILCIECGVLLCGLLWLLWLFGGLFVLCGCVLV